jgi:hypothetical protein
MNGHHHEKKEGYANASPGLVTPMVIFLLLWAILGVAAFIASLVCFGRSGTVGEKFLGLLLAFFLGPFYWLYFFLNTDYCR